MNYPRRWLGFWVIVSAIGVGVALLQWSWMTVAVAFVGATAMMSFFVVASSEVPAGARQLSALTWHVVAIGAEIAGGMLAFVAFANVSKVLSVCLLAAAGVSSPWLVRRLLRRTRASDAQPTYPSSRPEPRHEPPRCRCPTSRSGR